MARKILTKNGIENTNIDGARDNNFNSGRRSGIVKGALNQGNFFSSSSNTIALDTCELRLCGHRIVLDAIEYKTLLNIPSVPIRYSMISQIVVDDNNDVSFDLIIQSSSTPLVQENLDTTGKGKFQLEIGKFTQQTDGTITDIVRTADLITGGISDYNGGAINIGNVTTNTLETGMEAEVDVEERFEPKDKKTYTDFTFSIPKGDQGIQGIQGVKGETGATGNGIISISKTGTSKLVDTYTISFTSGETTTFQVTNGKGITKIEKTATSGLVDTYTITFNDATTNTFQVTNGAKGDKGDKGDQGIQGEKGDQGIQGVQGEKGEKGDKGDTGVTPNITATATTLPAGSSVTVTKSGTAENPTFDFGIPKGEKGDKGDKGDQGESGLIYQTTGQNTNGAMSQKATTDALAKKMDNFSLSIGSTNGGNPRPTLFITVDYNNFTSESGAYFKLSATGCHGNGVAYAFLEDIIIGVHYTGVISCNVYKYAQTSGGTYQGADRHYGDVFYVHDSTAKTVKFYILLGQYSSAQFTPATKIGLSRAISTANGITQHTGAPTYYDSGDIIWATGNDTTYARLSDIPEVVQSTGTDTSKVMSQKATTDELTAIATALSNKFSNHAQSAYDCNTCYDEGVYLIASGSNCPSGSQYGSLFVMPYRKPTGNTKPDYAVQIFIPNGDDNSKPNSMFYRTSLENSWNDWREVATTYELSFKMDKSGGTFTGQVNIDSNNGSYIAYNNNFNIKNSQAESAFTATDNLIRLGISGVPFRLYCSTPQIFGETRPNYNGVDMALKTDIPSITSSDLGIGTNIEAVTSWYATWRIDIGDIKIIGGATPSEEGKKNIGFRMNNATGTNVFTSKIYYFGSNGRYQTTSTANGWQYSKVNDLSSGYIVQISHGSYWFAIGK